MIEPPTQKWEIDPERVDFAFVCPECSHEMEIGIDVNSDGQIFDKDDLLYHPCPICGVDMAKKEE